MVVSHSYCHKNTGPNFWLRTKIITLFLHICRLSAGQLIWVWLSWAQLGLPVVSTSVPHNTHPPWTSGPAPMFFWRQWLNTKEANRNVTLLGTWAQTLPPVFYWPKKVIRMMPASVGGEEGYLSTGRKCKVLWIESRMKNWEQQPSLGQKAYMERRALFLHTSTVMYIYAMFTPNSRHQELMPMLFHWRYLTSCWCWLLAQRHITRAE